MVSSVQTSIQARPSNSIGRIRFAGLACLIGGLLWAALVTIEQLQAPETSIFTELLIPLPMLLGMACGPLGLLALGASGRLRKLGFTGTTITLIGICSYVAATLSKYVVGEEVEFFYPIGALLVGIGMLMLGIAVFVARQLPGWHRMATLIVGLYYVVMIPFQIVFFIIPNEEPSPILLGIWSITWILLGYSIWKSASRSQ